MVVELEGKLDAIDELQNGMTLFPDQPDMKQMYHAAMKFYRGEEYVVAG